MDQVTELRGVGAGDCTTQERQVDMQQVVHFVGLQVGQWQLHRSVMRAGPEGAGVPLRYLPLGFWILQENACSTRRSTGYPAMLAGRSFIFGMAAITAFANAACVADIPRTREYPVTPIDTPPPRGHFD